MDAILQASAVSRLRAVLTPGHCAALVALGLFAGIVALGAMRMPGGFHGESDLDALFALTATVWGIGFVARLLQPDSRTAAAVQVVAMMTALDLGGGLSAAALAPGGGNYIDPMLAASDRIIAPFLDYQAMYSAVGRHLELYYGMGLVYVSLDWEPFLAIGLAAAYGTVRRIDALASAWAFGLALVVLPFHLFPAQGTFAFSHFADTAIGRHFPLPPGGTFPEVLEALRNGKMPGLSLDSFAGLVSFPSFHACAAVVFSYTFWPYRRLRWPMVALNAGMALVAVPIGSHYVVDILAGVICGAIACGAAHALSRLKPAGHADPTSRLPELAVA